MINRTIVAASDDPADLEALTPNHFLLQRKVSGLPPGLFVHLGRKQWRKVQYLANVFWKRWINEYLPSLTERGKWLRDQRKVRVGDLVLVLEENVPRNKWTVGRVTEVFEGRDSKVGAIANQVPAKEPRRDQEFEWKAERKSVFSANLLAEKHQKAIPWKQETSANSVVFVM
ncbi:hypothetical protein ACROYT_G025661 [Oculina patagonica]